MEFWLQAGSPQVSGCFDAEDESLSDAIQTAFPLQTESAVLVWNHIYIPMSYKYDFSLIIGDLLDTLEAVLAASCGQISIHWSSSTFNAEWNLNWSVDTIAIDAVWYSLSGRVETILNSSGAVSLSTSQFLSEWKKPLEVIRTALEAAGYGPLNLPSMSRLKHMVERLPGISFLYAE